MTPRSGPGSCVSNVHLHSLHFGHQSLIIGSSASACDGPLVTAASTPLCCVWRDFCDQKGFPCSSGCRNAQNASKATIWLFGFWSKQTSEWQVTHPPSKISNKTQQLSWFTSFATVKKTPRKRPLYSGCTSKSALMNVTLIGDRIHVWCLHLLSFFTHKQLISDVYLNRLSLLSETTLYCPAAIEHICINEM